MTHALPHRPAAAHAARAARWAACLAALVLPALASANWTKVGESEVATLYMDRSSIQREEYVVRVWEIQDLKASDADGVRSRRYLNEYDCKHQMYRIGNMTSYAGPMLTGQKLFDVETKGLWRKVGGRSPFTLSFVIHCGR
ncbi:MAG: hypothetical protein RIS88_1566 [Pseudomonadota bacterium]|jgi:hypothetical protein